MELNPTLVGVIIIALIFVPIAYLIMSASGKDKKTKKSVSELSETNGIKLDEIDIIGNLVIGVDEVSKKLIYTSKRNISSDFKIINMAEVSACRAKTIKQGDKTLDWVGLEFMENSGKLEIAFYIETDDDGPAKDPYVCLQDAKRWEEKLRPFLKAS
jgi:hypothetical protein